jgi:hypothetical protein
MGTLTLWDIDNKDIRRVEVQFEQRPGRFLFTGRGTATQEYPWYHCGKRALEIYKERKTAEGLSYLSYRLKCSVCGLVEP